MGSAGAIGGHNNTPNRAACGAGDKRHPHSEPLCAFQRMSSYSKVKAMQVPSAVKPACWGAVGGAIVLGFVGFHWGGWMTSHSASKLADQRADEAIVAVLTPICVEKFQHNADAVANLVALKAISSSWQQGKFMESGGWATRPGAASPDYALAGACAERLVLAKTAAQ